MGDERAVAQAELVAERSLSLDEYWAAAEARLDWPLTRGLNLAHECCDRWADDRGRMAVSVHEPDGSVTRWTFYELMRASRAMANALTAAGLQRGDRFAALLDQQIESYICALAAWRAGIVYVPLFVGFGIDALVQRLEERRGERSCGRLPPPSDLLKGAGRLDVRPESIHRGRPPGGGRADR